MSYLEVILRLSLVAELVGYLAIKHHRRSRRPAERPDRPLPPGTALGTAPLRPVVDKVRHDYLAARHSPPAPQVQARLVKAALQEVPQLAYFHDRNPDDHSDAEHLRGNFALGRAPRLAFSPQPSEQLLRLTCRP